MDKKELPFLTASQLSRLIETKEVSPVEATEAYLDRIEAVDPKLNSYITVTGEQALEAARKAEHEIATSQHRGPLHGVPMAVKDQFNTAGIRTTGGSSILKDNIPDEDATVITNLKKAGAVMLGKLNMSEFAMAEIYNHPYGTPRNPWDLERNPGTSSSGSGAATAASLCATSLGEDTGGSIRGPANFSGLVGLRPSHGRVSRHGVLGGSWSMDTVGPISRSVEDAAITIQAIAGYDPKDRYSWNVPVPDYRQALTGDIQGIKLGVVQERMDSPNLDPEVRDTVAKAISALGELGASSQDVSIPLAPKAGALTMSILSVEWSNLHRPLFEPNIDELDHNNKIRFLTGSVIPAQFYYKAQKIRAVLRQQILDALEQVDVLVLPTGPVTAPPVESVPGVQSKEHALTGLAGRISFTGPFNLAGTPALSVPCGFSSSGMPMGLQIVGRPFAEETVLRVAHAYEQTTEWHNRRAPV
ncbi:MAG: aspartyl/glutamyl-tRNA amidotransferase subunit A [SAR202 cluster bacterium]|nr:aspartyl/glutamyl-tRNA amidotransferase subunit A [Dehalococcoidia bacterium]MQG50246.1 aspartyl/glutamyl-tRNA amidotransferase subunit A [SAR202 cluster bacterium]|tara:strand:+ start:4147 stop:5562 length:1416 start_codon:yes stop_codon:yes gene_type:complete